MIRNYIKTALRNLWKNKSYSALNILGLSVGITCAALIFLWVEDELNFDHQQAKQDRLYRVMENQTYDGRTFTFGATPGPLAQGMKAELPGVKNTCRTSWGQSTLFNTGEKNIYETGIYSDESIFDMFTLPFIKGSPVRSLQGTNNLVISEKMALSFFGTTDVIGKTLRMDNKDQSVITGVFKDLPTNSTLKFDWLAPFQVFFDRNQWLQQWGSNGIITYVETQPGTDLSALGSQLKNYIISKDTSAIAQPLLFAMKDWRLKTFESGHMVDGRIIYVRLFTTIAWIILLIACINFMNLATARSEKRAREVGVRKVLGAAKKWLILQFIGEAVLMSLIAVIIAVGFIALALPAFNALVEKQLYLGLNNPVHNTALLAIALVCGLVAGSYPSIYLSSFNPVAVLKGLKNKASSAAMIRKGLVVVQFTISIVLIICTMIIYQQINHVKSRQLGYNKERLISVPATEEVLRNFGAIRHDLVQKGLFDNAALAQMDMLQMGANSSSYDWQGKDPNLQVLITQDDVSPGYLSTTGVQLLSGRDFYPDGAQDSQRVVINETLAKIMNMKDPVGQYLSHDSVKYEVIGVVKDFIFGDMYGKTEPLVFYQQPRTAHFLYVRTAQHAQPEKALAVLESVLKQYNPAYPFNYRFVDEDFDRLFKTETMIGRLSRIFAVLAIFISCLGLFGLAAYTAERRTKEIGVRKVLGASVNSIAALLSVDFLKLVLISLLIAFPLSWLIMSRWLQEYAYRIRITWPVFVLAGLAALLIALITISFQAVRAGFANPIRSLRSE